MSINIKTIYSFKSVESELANDKHCCTLFVTSLGHATNFGDRVKRVDNMASYIFPESFTEGNFGAWLKHFEWCATANSWDAEMRVSMLPAFLQGPAATYFESLTEDQKATYDDPVASRKECLCPDVNRKFYCREFEDATFRPSEDPTLPCKRAMAHSMHFYVL